MSCKTYVMDTVKHQVVTTIIHQETFLQLLQDSTDDLGSHLFAVDMAIESIKTVSI